MMDSASGLDIESSYTEASLPYDDPVSYPDQLEPTSEATEAKGSLAERIGSNKVYLLSEAALAARVGKRKHDEVGPSNAEEDMDEDALDETIRDNAILLHGTPISHLPTPSLFAYATHFDAHPIGLEWIDDTTCILVFSSRSSARSAYQTLSKSPTEEPSVEGFLTAKPIPVALWPAEDRITKSLGKSEGLKGVIQMRWATVSDIKNKGSWETSKFYKKYGRKAGKPEESEEYARKRARGMDDGETWEKGNLDEEIDSIQAEYDSRAPPPRTRRRIDKSLLERTAPWQSKPGTPSLEARITSPLPRRAREGSRRDDRPSLQDRLGGEAAPRRQGQHEGRRGSRPKATQEELDAELDAFLNSKD